MSQPVLPASGTPVAGQFDDNNNFVQAIYINLAPPGEAPQWMCSAAPLPVWMGAQPDGAPSAEVQGFIHDALVAILAALSGTLNIAQATQPLPSGAATQTTAAAILAALGNTIHVQDASAEAALSTIATLLGNSLAVTGTFFQATQPISAASLPLPSGAATQTTLAAIGTLLAGGILVTDTTAEARLLSIVNALAGTLAISASALPLPSGASTAAKQDTGNSSLGSIDTKTPALSSGSVPVVLPAAQITALTPPASVGLTWPAGLTFFRFTAAGTWITGTASKKINIVQLHMDYVGTLAISDGTTTFYSAAPSSWTDFDLRPTTGFVYFQCATAANLSSTLSGLGSGIGGFGWYYLS